MKIVTYLIALIIIALGASFAALNATSVVIDFYLGKVSLPLSLLLAIAFVCGSIIGIFVCLVMIIKQKALLYQLKRKLSSTEKELVNLRSLPIKNTDMNK